MEMKMTAYNCLADMPKEEGTENLDYGFIPMSGYASEMRKDAVSQAKEAFENGRQKIFLALSVINDIISYARKEGLIALSSDADFRNGSPYILDLEEKEYGTVPLRQYLQFGLDHISNGEQPEYVEELVTNRYFANSYAAEDAFIAYIYSTSVFGILYGLSFEQMLDYTASIIPDDELCEFNAFADEKKRQNEEERYDRMCEKLKLKFERWDADRETIRMDKCSIMTIFNEMLEGMDDEGMKELLKNIDNSDICYSLLGAYDGIRRHVMGLLSERHRFILMEDWMNMLFAEREVEACLEAMGRVTKIGMLMKRE